MTITYPLSMPSVPWARRTHFRMQNAVGIATSPFTFKTQTHAHAGQRWLVEVELPRMRRDAAAYWQAFFLALRGRFGTFLLGDWDARSPRGSAGGTPVSNSGGSPSVNLAGDRVFYTTGWPALTTGVLLAGDYIQLGSGSSSRLHMVVADADSDSNGDMALDIEPALRQDVNDASAITVDNTVGVFHLTANNPGWESDAAITYGFSFACEEHV